MTIKKIVHRYMFLDRAIICVSKWGSQEKRSIAALLRETVRLHGTLRRCGESVSSNRLMNITHICTMAVHAH